MAADIEFVTPRARLAHYALVAYSVLVYGFLFAPIALLIAFSFNANRFGTFPVTGWTLAWYRQVFDDATIQDALVLTLRVAAEVTIVSTIVGTAAAFPLVRSRLRFRSGLRLAFTVPIMIPGVLIGVSLLIFFTDVLGVQLSAETAAVGQSVFTTPFVLLLVAARLEGFDRSIERAASDLGANAYRRMRYVVLPLIAPAIFAGALFAFTLSVDEFVVTNFLIGNDTTLPIFIYSQIKYGVTPEVNALATLLLVSSVALVACAALVPLLLRRLRGVRA
jgi:ABC-type spermidine/putrescine transport system permease subunit II